MKYVAASISSATLLSIALLSGCAPSPTTLHPKFGQAVKQAKEQQVLNPKASENLDPVEGLHANSADKAMTQYEKSFAKQPGSTKNVGVLTLSSGGGN